jgi:hypothetical protein
MFVLCLPLVGLPLQAKKIDLVMIASSEEQVFDEGRDGEDRKHEQHKAGQAHAPHHAPVAHHTVHHRRPPLC